MRAGLHVFVLALSLSPLVAEAQVVRLLIAAGQNRGLASERPLALAEQDAERFARVFEELGGTARVWRVENATQARLEAAFVAARREAQRHREENVQLLFYFSGHADRVDLHLAGERYAQADLEDLMATVPAGLRLSVVDACQSDPDILAKGGFGRAPAFDVDIIAPKNLSGTVRLSSSSPGEASQESRQLGGAVFTHYLVTALRGAADRDGDRQVTLAEAYAFAYAQTVRRSAEQGGNVMHPNVDIDLEGAGALVLTTASRRQARLQLPPGEEDLYLIFAQPAGSVIAELRSQSDRETAISVPPGRYLITRRGPSGSGASQVSLRPGATEEVESGAFVPVAETILAEKGGRLALRYHDVGVAYGPGVSHAGTLSQLARIRYAWGGLDYRLSASLDLGQTSYEDTAHTRQERWVGGDVRGEVLSLLGPVDVSLGLAWRAIDQELTRKDGALLERAGISSRESFTGFAAGPTASLGYRRGFGARFTLALEIRGTLFLRSEGGSITARPELTPELLLRVQL